jgi:DNA-directed RNA polymerase
VSQVNLLAEALAESALEIFSKNVLESFAEQVKMQLSHEADAVPALPQQGEFDITTLKDSEYFFS